MISKISKVPTPPTTDKPKHDIRRILLLAVLVCIGLQLSFGCNPTSPPKETNNTDGGTKDTAGTSDTGNTDQAPVAKQCDATTYKPQSCGAHPTPGSGEKYGGQTGDILAAFDTKLSDCERNKLSLRELTCGAKLLLFNVGAGWCQPCLEETKTIEEMVHGPFCSRGLRIVQVLFEDDRRNLPTTLFCGQWQKRYSLSFPILIDALKQTQALFDFQSGTPLNLLVDAKTMKILFRWEGEVPKGLEDVIEKELKKRE